MEVWKQIEGYNSLYEISNYGNVKALDKYVKGVNCVKFYKSRMLKNAKTKNYLFITLYDDKKHKSFYIHRLVARAFIENPENKKTVNHINGDKLNNCVENLEWNTQSENNFHSYATGLKSAKGESSGRSRLTEKQIFEIRSSTKSNVELTRDYNITSSMVSNIIARRTWKHI